MIAQDRIDRGLYWQQAWSLIEGCSPVSEGCAHCWSARQAHMRARQKNPAMRARYGGLTDGPERFNGKVRLMRADLDKPRRAKRGRVYAIWNDLFHRSVKLDFLDTAFGTMLAARQHVYLALTKRPVLMVSYFEGLPKTARALSTAYQHVWFGVTAETQKRLEQRITHLGEMGERWGANLFISIEPMLEPMNLAPVLEQYRVGCVIVGGESGPHARPMEDYWALAVVEQCREVGVPAFVKQMGTWWAKGKGGDRKGARMEFWPEALRVRELPWA